MSTVKALITAVSIGSRVRDGAWFGDTQSRQRAQRELVSSWSFMSRQHLRSYQDEYRLVTVCNHGYIIVLLHRENEPPAP